MTRPHPWSDTHMWADRHIQQYAHTHLMVYVPAINDGTCAAQSLRAMVVTTLCCAVPDIVSNFPKMSFDYFFAQIWAGAWGVDVPSSPAFKPTRVCLVFNVKAAPSILSKFPKLGC